MFEKIRKKLKNYNKKVLIAAGLLLVLVLGTTITVARNGSFNIFADTSNKVTITAFYNGSRASGATVQLGTWVTRANSSGEAIFYSIPFAEYDVTSSFMGCSGASAITVNSADDHGSVAMVCGGDGGNGGGGGGDITTVVAGPSITSRTPGPVASTAVPSGNFKVHGKAISGGAPLQNVSVSVRSSGGSINTATTDAQGSYSITTAHPWNQSSAYYITFNKLTYRTIYANNQTTISSLGAPTSVSSGGDYALRDVSMSVDTSNVTILGSTKDQNNQMLAGVNVNVAICQSSSDGPWSTQSLDKPVTDPDVLAQNPNANYMFASVKKPTDSAHMCYTITASKAGYTPYQYNNWGSPYYTATVDSSTRILNIDIKLRDNTSTPTPLPSVSPSKSPSSVPNISATPAPSASTEPILQCLNQDPQLPQKAQEYLRQLNVINSEELATLDPVQVVTAIGFLRINNDPMAQRLTGLISNGELNRVEIGNFMADYLGRQTGIAPEILNLIRNLEQDNFDDYLSSHHADVDRAIELARGSDEPLAILLNDIVNDTVVNGFNKQRTIEAITAYLDQKYNLTEEATELISSIQSFDFGRYIVEHPDQARKAVEYIRERDPEIAARMEALFRRSNIRLSDVINAIGGSRSAAISSTQNNLSNISIRLNAEESLRYQFVAAANNGVIPQDQVQSIFGNSIRRAILQAGSPLIRFEATRIAALLLKNPQTFRTVISLLDNTDVSVELMNQLVNDGSINVQLNGRPVYQFGRVGVQVDLVGKLSTGKFLTNASASYNTCESKSGEITANAAGRLTGKLSITPRNGRWTGLVNVSANGASAELRFPF